jgi:hypothetical protein
MNESSDDGLMTSSSDSAFWSEAVRQTLRCYDEPLLRQVAAKLIRSRSHWPAEDLLQRCADAIEDAAIVDRRLRDLEPADRRLLAIIGHSRQPRWKLGNLLEILATLGSNEGPTQLFRLFEAGLLYPVLNGAESKAGTITGQAPRHRLRSFDQWLSRGVETGFSVFACPQVSLRAKAGLDLPKCPSYTLVDATIHEADGLEWPLRLAALWQELSDSSIRWTQSGELFKRDLDRLRDNPVLNAPPADNLSDLPDPSLLAVALGQIAGVVVEDQAEVRAGTLPAEWDDGLPSTLLALWSALPLLESWNPRQGWCGKPVGNNPYPSAYLLALLTLAGLPKDGWARAADIEAWLRDAHPFWREDRSRPARDRGWVQTFLLGFAYHLRIVQAAKGPDSEWLVRLSPTGRWLLALAEEPAELPSYTKTLLIQPNHEIIVYRQGLSTGLLARLSRFAAWKSVGAACMLDFQARHVYRALESGMTASEILQTLEQHSTHEIPPTVIQSLRTWANKRERITVYPSATLFEFGTDSDLNEALARGVPGTRLSERLLAVANESAVDFRHFRLTGTRDYGLPPEKCVEIEADGITLAVDVSKSDLLLETELQRFAVPLDPAGVNSRRRYQLTPASLAQGQANGFGQGELRQWFRQRAGKPPSAAALLILGCHDEAPFQLRTQVVLHVPSEELADGLEQWPNTRRFIKERLGPTALVIDESDASELQQQLANIGITLEWK